MKLTDEMLRQAAAEAMDAVTKSLPEPEECDHEFSFGHLAKMAAFMANPDDDPYLDPTGVRITPSWQGKDCLGNGEHPGYECCCDECAFFLVCFPEYDVFPGAKQ